jgi:hypothetical protein
METQNWQARMERLEANYWRLQDEYARVLEAIEEARKRTLKRLEHEQMLRDKAALIRMELQLWWMGGDGHELD